MKTIRIVASLCCLVCCLNMASAQTYYYNTSSLFQENGYAYRCSTADWGYVTLYNADNIHAFNLELKYKDGSPVTLDANGKRLFESALLDRFKECGYKAMFDYLESSGFKLADIKIDPNLVLGDGGYKAGENVMAFKSNDVISTAFTEEFVHFFQNFYYPDGISLYDNVGRSNIEFEAKLIMDILCMRKGTACPWYGKSNNNDSQYTNWITTITHDGIYTPQYSDLIVRHPSCDNKNYWDFLEDLKNDTTKPYNYPVDINLIPSLIGFIFSNGC